MGIPAESEPHIRFGEFDLDLCTRELRTYDRRLILQEQSFQILAALLEHPGHLVTRDELKRLRGGFTAPMLWQSQSRGD
jgi:DNA-binding winged helix-turn-helix (wHTH) protein